VFQFSLDALFEVEGIQGQMLLFERRLIISERCLTRC
jgi:hypothetical protein